MDERERDIEATQEGVSAQRAEGAPGDRAVASEPTERQAVEVRPMRYVLGIGIAGGLVLMALAYVFV